MAKKFAEITGIHKIFDTITISEGPNSGTTIYRDLYITDSELQKNIDENTIVFVTADNTDVDRIIGPNNYKISKDDCFIVAQNKVYATFGKVNVSDVMGPTGPTGQTGSQYIQINSSDQGFQSAASNIISDNNIRVGDYSISIDTNTIWRCISDTEFSRGPSIKGDTGPTGPAGTDASMPIGSIMMFAGDTAPEGWLICDGRRIPVDNISDCNVIENFYEYSELASIIKNKYGGSNIPDAATSTSDFVPPEDEESFEELFEDYSTEPCINIPQFKGRFPYGSPSTTGLGRTGGNSSVTLNLTNIPYHTHRVLIPDVNSSYGNNSGANNTDGSEFGTMTSYTTNTMDDYNSSKPTTPFSILPPYLSINFIIKYK